MLHRPISLGEILSLFEGTAARTVGAADTAVTHPAPFDDVDSSGAITFCRAIDTGALSQITRTAASVVICPCDDRLAGLDVAGKTLLMVADPRLAFIRVVRAFFTERLSSGIHPSASIDPDAEIHPSVHVGPYCSVGRCVIGEGSVLVSHVTLRDRTRVGRNVMIHSGAVIGADGFGYQRNEQGQLEKFPHVGGVIIEDDVEIGANTCVDRGTLDDTRICEGAKIDNLVHIAHNVVVGRHAVVIAQAMVGGSTIIGDYAWVAPAAALINKIVVGERATVGLGAVVVKDVAAGETVMGVPARPSDEYKALMTRLKTLSTRSES